MAPTLLDTIKESISGGSAGAGDSASAFGAVCGSPVVGRTVLGDAVAGEVYAIDTATQSVSIVTAQEKKRGRLSFSVYLVDALEALDVVSGGGAGAGAGPSKSKKLKKNRLIPQRVVIEAPDVNAIKVNEARVLERYRKLVVQEKASYHPSVSPFGRKVFTALAKTYPVTWGSGDGSGTGLNPDVIVVADEVHISPPYASADASLSSNLTEKELISAKALCERLKMVLAKLAE